MNQDVNMHKLGWHGDQCAHFAMFTVALCGTAVARHRSTLYPAKHECH